MNTSEDSAQHYHRAVAATKQGDIDIAIAELDLCLCSNPPITSSMIAWFDLNTVIVRKFDFPHREGSTISDEEFMWQHRAEKCLKNVISIYEDTISHTAKAAAYRNLYERAKDRLARTSGFGEIMLDAGGTLSLRSTEVFFRVTLPPLKCLAEQERKRRKEERLVYERTAPLRGGYRMQDVVRYLVRGLEFASENQKVPATEFLTKVVENLDESDPEHRKLLETAHFRLAALHSDLDNSEEAVKHAEWVLRNAPPANEALRMMLETILKMYGRNIHVAWKRPNIAPRNDPASTSGSMSGRISLAILAVICLGLGIYFVGGRQTANSSSRSENIGRVSTENLNLRSNPGTNQPVIMQLPQGTKVIILNESQNIGGTSWVKVRVGQQEGWVNQKHIQ